MGKVRPPGRALRLEREKSQRLLLANVQLEEDCARKTRLYQVAMRDALRAQDLAEAAFFGAEAAAAMFRAGLPKSGEAILSALRMGQIDALRWRVSNEPGGVNYERSSDTSTDG